MKNLDKASVLRLFRDNVVRKKIPPCESLANQVSAMVHDVRMANLETIFSECDSYTKEQNEETMELLENKMKARIEEIRELRKEVDKILRLTERVDRNLNKE